MKIPNLAFLILCFVNCSWFGEGKRYNDNLLLLGLYKSGEDVPKSFFVGSGTIGPNGGSIISSDKKFQLFIPANALDKTIEFQINKFTNLNDDALPNSYFPSSEVYEITPSYNFKKAVNISIVMDSSKIANLGLSKNKSLGFSAISTNSSKESAIINGWVAGNSKVLNDRVVLTSQNFSYLAVGTPPPGNLAPIISGVTYYFQKGLQNVPNQIRAKVLDPEGDNFEVFILIGRQNTRMYAVPMNREGTTDFYSYTIPPDLYTAGPVTLNSLPRFQVVAEDSWKNSASVPNSLPFVYPTSDPSISLSSFNPNQDGDAWVDLWEVNNGYNPNSSSSPAISIPDTDLDGIGDGNDNYIPGNLTDLIVERAVPAKPILGSTKTFVGGPLVKKGGQIVIPFGNTSTDGIEVNPDSDSSLSVVQLQDDLSIFTAQLAGTKSYKWKQNYSLTEASFTPTVYGSEILHSSTDFSTFLITRVSNREAAFTWRMPLSVLEYGIIPNVDLRYSPSVTPITNDRECDLATPLPIISKSFSNAPSGQIAGDVRFSVLGLTPNTSISLCVRIDSRSVSRTIWDNTTPVTLIIPFSWVDVVSPSTISNLTATTLSDSSIQLSWPAVVNSGSFGPVTTQYVFRASVSDSGQSNCSARPILGNLNNLSAPGTPLIFNIGFLSGNTVYYFCIEAIDPSGNKSISNTAIVTTFPTNLSPVFGSNSTSLDVPKNIPVILDESSVADPDGVFCGANTGSYIYSWSFISVPSGSTLTNANISNSNTTIASFTPDLVGTYQINFSFTDHQGSCYPTNKTVSRTWTVNVHTNIFQEAYIKRDIFENNGLFGSAVAADGDYLAVGSPGDDANQTTITNATFSNANTSSTDSGAVFIYRKTSSGNWIQDAYIKPSNAIAGQLFGQVIALEGDLLAVGNEWDTTRQTTITNGTTNAPAQSTTYTTTVPGQVRCGIWMDGNGIPWEICITDPPRTKEFSIIGEGSVYLYRRKSTGWEQEAYLKAPNATQSLSRGDRFGATIDIENGSVFVGAPFERGNQTTISTGTYAANDTIATDKGAVYSFVKDGSLWRFDTYFKTSLVGLGFFVKAAGNRLAVTDNANHLYIYRNDSGVWTQEAIISLATTISGINPIDFDGNRVAVALVNDINNLYYGILNSTTVIPNSLSNSAGAVVTYVRSGTTWNYESFIRHPRQIVDTTFASSLSLQGNLLAVGFEGDSSNNNVIKYGKNYGNGIASPTSGAVQLYRFNSGIGWAEEAYIKPINPAPIGLFGRSIFFNSNRLYVGAPGEPSSYTGIINGAGAGNDQSAPGRGSVYVYTLQP
ncbi:FG-GAP repeat protein [Leptospira andrefontaineae]|uniref:Fibronectin type-III domain-containing protein n=1 Tax=Leptospira andrefontaineae TaxID=2484976 RepID=A0A4R9HDE8_9LEPT|nr:FG-GAP repeat protein [Leptospira andrefontaineae]TGK44683.1 hypothetical protein EHO65_01190 [Leptospira andrefontaineae]